MKPIIALVCLSLGFLTVTWAAKNQPQPVVESLNSIVAVVNNDVITQSSLDQQVSIIKHQLQMAHQPLPSNAELKKKVLNQLIDQKLILQIAKAHHITVSKEQLNSAIEHIATQNHLTMAQLKQQVQQQGIDYKQYKEQIHKQLVMNAVEREAVGGNVQVTDAEIKKAMQQASSQIQNIPEYNLEAMLVPVPAAPTSEQLQAAQAKANSIISQLHDGESFSTIALTETFNNQPLQGGNMGWRQLSQLPPAIAGELAGAMTGSVIGPVQTPNGFYIIKVLNTRSLNATHNVRLMHLRIIVLKQGNLQTGDAVKAKLENIRERIVKGASFATMAQDYSQDSRTAHQGGELGWVASGEIPPQLAQAVANLKTGQISQPVNTKDGWMIVKLEGTRTVNNSQANLRERVKQMIYIQKFETAVKNWVHTLRGNAFIKINS